MTRYLSPHSRLHAHALLRMASYATQQGSSAAPEWFVSVINEEIPDRDAAYLDKLIVFYSDPFVYVLNFNDHSQRLRNHKLSLSLSLSLSHDTIGTTDDVELLGHTLSPIGASQPRTRWKPCRTCPSLTSDLKQLRSFLDGLSYRRKKSCAMYEKFSLNCTPSSIAFDCSSYTAVMPV